LIHRLRKRKQRLAATVHRQHLGAGIGRGNAVTTRNPGGNRLAQGFHARGERVARQSVQVGNQRILDKLRRGMLGARRWKD